MNEHYIIIFSNNINNIKNFFWHNISIKFCNMLRNGLNDDFFAFSFDLRVL